MKLFLDLDGTLVDSKERLYNLFQHLVSDSAMSFEEYWHIKRQGISHKEILSQNFNYSEQEIQNFEQAWLSLIELPEWLKFDQPFEGIFNHLVKLKSSGDLYLVTSRQHEQPVQTQLFNFGWNNLFKDVLVTKQLLDKKSLIEKVIKTGSKDWIVGDTGSDIKSGKLLGIKTAAVLTGFLSKERLSTYNPDLLLESILDFK